MIFLIAFIPAAIVLVVAVASRSKYRATVAALAGSAFGVFTGNPIYAVLDVVSVLIAYALGLLVIALLPSKVAVNKFTDDQK